MKERAIIAAIVLFATALLVLGLLMRGYLEIAPAQRHLFHGLIIVGAALSGILFAGSGVHERPGGVVWLGIALIAPLLAVFLMLPSEYAYFEAHRYGHIAEHLSFAVLGFVTGFGLQRFTAGTGWAVGIGWVAGIGIFAMALLVIWENGFRSTPSAIVAAAPASPPAASGAGLPNIARGGTLFAKNCASCHGVAGAGGDSPMIMNERARKSPAQLQQWIEKPSPPMPKLYPKPLSLQDVVDIAAYIDDPAMSNMLKKAH